MSKLIHLVLGFIAGTAGLQRGSVTIQFVDLLGTDAFREETIIDEPHIAMLHHARFYQHTPAVRLLRCYPGDVDTGLGIRIRALDHVLAAHTEARFGIIEQLEVACHILSAVRYRLILALHDQAKTDELHVDGARK